MNRILLALSLVALLAAPAFAQRCGSGGCGSSNRSNAAIQDRQDQIDQLDARIRQLTSLLRQLESVRGIAQSDRTPLRRVADRDDLVQIGRDDGIDPVRIQTVQQAPRRVQTQVRVNPTPRRGNGWRN